MRYLGKVMIGIAMFAVAVSFSGLSYAEMGCCAAGACKGKTDSSSTIKVLRDSAMALQASNPDLAKGLNDLADKRIEEMKKWQEWKDAHAVKIKLLKDSSVALKTSNPALAKELQKMCEGKYMKKGTMEKEEAREKMETIK